ncbi:MAG: hypothetical protein ABIR96_12980 [Bdellovibrionota bacterium]
MLGPKHRRKLFWLLIVFGRAVGAAPSATTSSPDERILELRLKDRTLISEGLVVEETRGERFLPVEELFRQLGFQVESMPERGIFRAKVYSEDFDLELRMSDCEIRWKNETSRNRSDAACRDLIFKDGDIFLSESRLAEILAAHFAVDELRSLMTVDFEQAPPLIALHEREQENTLQTLLRANESLGNTKATFRNSAGNVSSWQGPRLYQSFGLSTGNEKSQRGADLAGNLWAQDHDIDLNYAYAWSHGNFVQDWQLSKEDPERHIGGFLGLSRVMVGDLYTAGIDLVATSRKVQGILVSSFDLDATIRGRARSFAGRSWPEAYVELHQNGVLVSAQRTDKLGDYLFPDVLLYPGSNSIELFFFGPQGERSSERRVYFVRPDVSGDRNFSYQATVGRDGGSELSLITERTQWSNDLALSASLARFAQANMTRSVYLQSQLQGSLPFVSWDLAGALSDKGALASQVQTLGGWERLRLRTVWQHGDGKFISSSLPDAYGDPLKNNIEASVAVPLWSKPTIGLGLAWQHRTWLTKGYEDVSRFTQTLSLPDYFFQNEFRYLLPAETWSDNLVAERRWSAWQLRSEASYDFTGWQEGRASLNYRSRNLKWVARAFYDRKFSDHVSSYGVGSSHDLRWARLLSNVELASKRVWNVFAALEFSLERENRSGSLHLSSRNRIAASSLSLHTFQDNNGNGVQDNGEENLEGLRVLLNKVEWERPTSHEGDLFLSPLSPNTDYRVEIHPLDLMKRNVQTSLKTYPFRNRPGVNRDLVIPLVPVASVEGYLSLPVRGGASRAARYFALKLISVASESALAARSDREGYFSFEDVPAGRYRLYCGDVSAKPLREIDIDPRKENFPQLGNLECSLPRASP